MSGPNGHANGHINGSYTEFPAVADAQTSQLPLTMVRELVAALEVPFDPSVVEWRVTNRTKDGQRGQMNPYADPRAYTDRLNELVTPAGWTRSFDTNTSAAVERKSDQKLVAKVLITCVVTINGIGSHSATGEEWADDDNASTSAEAQSFKRACACFGLGRYLYHFSGVWVDLDGNKRPKQTPKLPAWATPEGWRRGLRPGREVSESSPGSANGQMHKVDPKPNDEMRLLVRDIEQMERPLGRRLYRGILKTDARAWKPNDIRDISVLRKVLANMQLADRALVHLAALLKNVGSSRLIPILESLKLRELDQVDSLEVLTEIVTQLEKVSNRR